MADPISTDTLYVLLVAGATIGGAGWAVWREVAASRKESQEGRSTLHRKIDDLTDKIDQTYVRRDVYAADQRVAAHRDEELQTTMRVLSERVCPLGREREKPPGE